MRPELRSLKCHKLLSKILDLSDPLKRFAKTVTGFLLSISKNTKSFFSHLLFELYKMVYFIFVFQDLQNSILCGPTFALCAGL